MKIGVISDTHIPKAAGDIPEQVYSELRKVDLILHAGDIVELSFLEKLKKIGPLKAVRGNMDERKVQLALPDKEIIEVGKKFRIGLMHGYGSPSNLVKIIGNQFNNVDVIVFGHSHSAMNELHNGVLFFNPGSPTDKIFARSNSFGILEVNDTIKGKIIKL